MIQLRGECMCGSVGYLVEDAFDYAFNCHCSACRKVTGAAFKPVAGIAIDKLHLIKGTEHLSKNGTESYDLFCGLCGSVLYSVVREGAIAHVLMGCLIDTPTIRPSLHIFVGSKAPWYEITDDLPQHQEF